MRHGSVAIVQQRLPIRQHTAMHDAGAGEAVGGGFDHFELSDDRVTDAFDLSQSGCRRAHHTIKISKYFKEFVGKRFYILARYGAEEQEFQQLVIRQSLRAARQETRAEAFAVVSHIRGQFAGR